MQYVLVLNGIKYPMKSNGHAAISTINFHEHNKKLIIREMNRLLLNK